MSGMKVDQRRPADERSGRAQHVRHQVGGQRAEAVRHARRERPPGTAPRPAPGAPIDDVDLNQGDRLGIFGDLPPPEASTGQSESPLRRSWACLAGWLAPV